jgi:hypothetical protein
MTVSPNISLIISARLGNILKTKQFNMFACGLMNRHHVGTIYLKVYHCKASKIIWQQMH